MKGENSMPETELSSRRVYDGKIIKLRVDEVRLDNGLVATREVIDHPGAVAILAEDPEGRVLLVRQFRYACLQELWELPAGKLEPGEEPRLAAQRELAEEAGFAAMRWQLLFTMYTAPGFCNEQIWLWHARDLAPGALPMDWDESIAVQPFSRQELREMLEQGLIRDAKTLVGVLHFLSN